MITKKCKKKLKRYFSKEITSECNIQWHVSLVLSGRGGKWTNRKKHE